MLEGGAFRDVKDAVLETLSDIESYYKRVRRHSSLGYLNPAEYEQTFDEKARQSTLADLGDHPLYSERVGRYTRSMFKNPSTSHAETSGGKTTTPLPSHAQIPLWLRFLRLFRKEARPSMRDALLAVVVLAAALVYKVAYQQLTWKLTVSNLLEAQFPIVAAAVVFFVVHVVKTGYLLIKEVRAESGEIEYDPYPSLVLSEKIRATKKNEPPHYFRLRVLSFAAIFIVSLCALGVLSWKLNALVSVLSPQSNVSNANTMMPTPTPITSPPTPTPTNIISTPVPTPASSSLLPARKSRRKRPTAAEIEERRRIDRDLNSHDK